MKTYCIRRGHNPPIQVTPNKRGSFGIAYSDEAIKAPKRFAANNARPFSPCWRRCWCNESLDAYALDQFYPKVLGWDHCHEKNLTTSHPCSMLITQHHPSLSFPQKDFCHPCRKKCADEVMSLLGTNLSSRKSIPSPVPKTTTKKGLLQSPMTGLQELTQITLTSAHHSFKEWLRFALWRWPSCFAGGFGGWHKQKFSPQFLAVGTGGEQKVGWNSW